MGSPAVGNIVLVKFPFSDLRFAKMRPALVIAQAEFGGWVLCQITSSPYSSKLSIMISDKDIKGRGLMRPKSYIRPDKIFTTDETLIAKSLGVLSHSKRLKVKNSLFNLLEVL